MDFYATLGIPVDADQETIRSAYRVLARRYHPDRGTGSSVERFRQVAEAYETLIDPGRRRGYDLARLPTRLGVSVIRVDPRARSAEPLGKNEDPSIFGQFENVSHHASFRSPIGLAEVLERLMDSFEEDFLFGLGRRW